MSIYTAHLAAENGQLREMLHAIGVPFDVWSDAHFAEALRSDLPARFVATTLAHNNMIYKGEFFRQTVASPLLETISAAQIRPCKAEPLPRGRGMAYATIG
jgi:hypothetical protein